MQPSRLHAAFRRALLAIAAAVVLGAPATAQTLFNAIERGDIATVKALIAEDRGLVNRGVTTSPLRLAFEAGQMEIAGVLLDNGADPAESEFGLPIYFIAVWKRNDGLRLLLEHGFDAGTEHNGYPLLQFAVGFDSLDAARLLLEHGAKVNDTNRYGRTALYMCRSSAMVDLLISHGGNAAFATSRNVTPLHYAALNDSGAATALLRHGANIDAKDADGDTPLSWAAMYWRPACMAALLQAGAGRDPHGWHGQTPLVAAVARYAHNLRDSIVRRNGTDIMMSLTTADAQPQGSSAPAYSLDRVPDTVEISATIDLLLGSGADVDATDANGSTALHHAARAGMTTVAERLIQGRANLNVRDRKGRTPLALARAARNRAMVRMLAAAGAR